MSYKKEENRPILKAKRFIESESKSTAFVNYKPQSSKCTNIKSESTAFANYIPDTSKSTNETVGRPRLKRTYDEINESEAKKFRNDFRESQGPTKNLANNRLQRLKQALRSDLEQNHNLRDVTGTGVTTVSISELSRNTTMHQNVFANQKTAAKSPLNTNSNTMGYLSNRNFGETQMKSNVKHGDTKPQKEAFSSTPLGLRQSSSKNIYENLEKWAHPSDAYPEKNSANQRLNRLKKVINDIKSTKTDPSISKNFGPLQTPQNDDTSLLNSGNNFHCSGKISGTKRSLDNCCQSDEEYSTPSKRPSPFKHESPLLRNKPESHQMQSPFTQNFDRQFQTNFSSDDTRKYPFMSNRMVKIDKNMESINNAFNDQSATKSIDRPGERNSTKYETTKQDLNNKTSNSTPTSYKMNRNLPNDPHNSRDDVQLNRSNLNMKFNCEKSDNKNVSTPGTENIHEDEEKWKMTAAWVWNHQNTNTPEQSESAMIAIKPISEEKHQIDDMEEMEWTNAEPDTEIIETPQKFENSFLKNQDSKDLLTVEKSKELCIVVDTNIFISNLSKIKDIMNLKSTADILPIIYVPWMVITELDYMKHSSSDAKLKQKVVTAIRFINTTLENKNPRFLGQTINDMEKQKSIGINQDDKIVSCCLQAREKYETVILLSNDLNLRSKALINNITASSANEIIMKIVSKTTKTVKSQKVMQKMSMLCSSVICECAKETYGDVWSKMDMLSNPPWSLNECLKRFQKYWPTVFKDKVMKQFTMTVDQLLAIFQKNKYIEDDSKDYVTLMKLCINLCIFLKDVTQCRGTVENILRDLTNL